MSIDNYLVEHCSPTLASLKTANLFSCRYDSDEQLQCAVQMWNALFSTKGIELIILKQTKELALIYVCRKNRLCADLNKPGVAEFLKEYGYHNNEVEYSLSVLKERLAASNDFPHEIGIFLDYPLNDVKGFIENSGANFKCSGCWKVYCNECDAIRTFHKYKKCREVYSRLFRSGTRDILQLTVKA